MVWVTYLDTLSPQISVHRKVPRMQYLAIIAAAGPLEFACKFNIESNPLTARQTGIGATIGGITREVPMLLAMMEHGMNICRVNVSHRTHEYHAESIRNIRTAEEQYRTKTGMPFCCAIAIDTKGPEIRTGFIEGGTYSEIELKKDHIIKLTTDPIYMHKCTNQVIYINYEDFHLAVEKGTLITIDDGRIMLTCLVIEGVFITCKILTDGVVSDNRLVTIPDASVQLPNVSEKDKADLKFAVKQKADIVLASFTRSAQAVKDIKECLGNKGKYIKIVAKIEDQQGFENLNEIIMISDGVLIGKGDIGIRSSIEKFFITQKLIASHCNKFGKPVICTRELWEALITSPRPTRADIVDIGNAVHDGVDCFMLTRENVKGIYPVACLQILSVICREAEATIWQTRIIRELRNQAIAPLNILETIAIVSVEASIKGSASAIIVLTESGVSAHTISRYRPRCPILAVTRNAVTSRQAHLYRGIIPLLYEEPKLKNKQLDMDNRVQFAINNGKKFGFINKNDYIVVVFEWGKGTGTANSFQTLYVKENVEIINDLLYVY